MQPQLVLGQNPVQIGTRADVAIAIHPGPPGLVFRPEGRTVLLRFGEAGWQEGEKQREKEKLSHDWHRPGRTGNPGRI